MYIHTLYRLVFKTIRMFILTLKHLTAFYICTPNIILTNRQKKQIDHTDIMILDFSKLNNILFSQLKSQCVFLMKGYELI